MEEIQYVGEHLTPGLIGRVAIVLSFCAALFSTISYWFATQRREHGAEANQWKMLGRIGYLVHGFAVFWIIGTMFYLMLNQYYEYQYVQAHVSDELPNRYLFSAFWAGQEGSFLLWMFWHVVLGLLLMASAKDWESPVLAVVAAVQTVLASMLLGIYFEVGDTLLKIGTNPLLLLRDVMEAPIFARADYLERVEGAGLNPSLQNWWMTIHPPTLFLGFASTVVPFSYAVAGLWLRRHREWLAPALKWSLMSGAILGTGILMGGAWAYEALNFGGYWAWDPVENMSLVPWLILIAGIHTNLIAKATGQAIKATYLYYLLTFVLIIYSSYLTRSGVLGETSVHSFVTSGLEPQLISFLVIFLIFSTALFFSRIKGIPAPEKEEAAGSREFWMFIGSLVLLLSAGLITGSTSLPVFNKVMQLFDPLYEGRVITDVEPHYNRYQLWIGVFIGLLSGISQYLRWRERRFTSHLSKFVIHAGVAIALSGVLTYLTTLWIDAHAWQYQLLLFSGWFTVITNLDYLITFVRGNLKLAGSVVSHLGFGIMILGILASGLNKRVISKNPFLMEGLSEDEELTRNTVLLIKDSPMLMEDYELVMTGDTLVDFTRTYDVAYTRRDADGNVVETFDLHPNVLYARDFTNVVSINPSTRHYWNKDVFTVIASLPEEEVDFSLKQQREKDLSYRDFDLPLHETLAFRDTIPIKNPDTFLVKDFEVQVLGIQEGPLPADFNPDYEPQPGDYAIGATIALRNEAEDRTEIARPLLVLREEGLFSLPWQINELGARVKLLPELVRRVRTPDSELNYERFSVAEGETFTHEGQVFRFEGFDRQATHPDYEPKEADISVGAVVTTTSATTGEPIEFRPLFVITNGNQPTNVPDENRAEGWRLRFTSLDPNTGQATLWVARDAPSEDLSVPFAVASRSPRADWIALQAIEFPGINLFWIGSSFMMFGLTLSMLVRIRSRREEREVMVYRDERGD